MFEVLLFLWLVAYIVPIIRSFSSYYRSRKCVAKLADFLGAYGDGNPLFPPDRKDYEEELTNLLRYYPAIKEFVSYPVLAYNQSDEDNYHKAWKILYEIQMKRNELRLKLFTPLNPIPSLRELILLPLNMFRDLGFQPGLISSLFLNTAGWLISYLLGMFQPEIKALLAALLEKLIGT